MSRHVVENHHLVGVAHVVLEFLECPALGHDVRVFAEAAEPELVGLPVDHRQSLAWSQAS